MTKQLLIGDHDFAKLSRLLAARRLAFLSDRPFLDALEAELEQAKVVPTQELPDEVIRMNSLVRVLDGNTSRECEYRIVYPGDADASQGRISVLAPIGAALLGYRVGDDVNWSTPGGVRRFHILSVDHQPDRVQAVA